MAEELFDSTELLTLTDEDGVETEFEVVASLEMNGTLYYALRPVEDNDEGACVILKLEKDEDGEDILSTIDDDDEYETVADAFEDLLFNEVDYDAE